MMQCFRYTLKNIPVCLFDYFPDSRPLHTLWHKIDNKWNNTHIHVISSLLCTPLDLMPRIICLMFLWAGEDGEDLVLNLLEEVVVVRPLHDLIKQLCLAISDNVYIWSFICNTVLIRITYPNPADFSLWENAEIYNHRLAILDTP